MRIEELVWDDDAEEHIARHQVAPEEVEEMVFDPSALFLRTRSAEMIRYMVLGLTDGGRYLCTILEPMSGGRAYVVTARDMSDAEKLRFKQH